MNGNLHVPERLKSDFLTPHRERAESWHGYLKKAFFKTRSEIASALGISTRSFAQWLSEGAPGVPGFYCVEDCEVWRIMQDRIVKARVRARRRACR